jgi:hypothetical protein
MSLSLSLCLSVVLVFSINVVLNLLCQRQRIAYRCYEKGIFKLDKNKRKVYYFADQHQMRSPIPTLCDLPATLQPPPQAQVLQNATASSRSPASLPVSKQSSTQRSPDQQAPLDMTRLLLLISVLHKTNRIDASQRAILKDQALLKNEVAYAILEAFMADEQKDLDELSDSFQRLCKIAR